MHVSMGSRWILPKCRKLLHVKCRASSDNRSSEHLEQARNHVGRIGIKPESTDHISRQRVWIPGGMFGVDENRTRYRSFALVGNVI
jgi:hypothetical protein